MDTVSSNECVSSSTGPRVEKKQSTASFNTDIISHLPEGDVRHSKDLLRVVHQRLQDLLALVVLR